MKVEIKLSSVLIYLFSMLLIQATALGIDFGGEEIYPRNESCVIPPAMNGIVWEIGRDDVTVCCPVGTLPTGNTDEKKMLCRKPSPERGCDPNQNPGIEDHYCAGESISFKICCPADSLCLCNEDVKKPQCQKKPKIDFESSISSSDEDIKESWIDEILTEYNQDLQMFETDYNDLQ